MGYKLLLSAVTPHIKTKAKEGNNMDWLKEILGEELFKQFETAVSAHNSKPENKEKQIKLADLSKGEYVSKEKFSSLETDKGSIAEQLKTAQGLIDELKKGTGNNEELQGKIKTYETTVTDLQNQLAQEKLESAVKISLLSSGCKDVDYITFKLKEKGELAIDDSGKVKGMDDKLAALKTQFPSQFESKTDSKIDEQKLPDGKDNQDNKAPVNMADALKEFYTPKE